ncbi:type I secretion system permease/ATPase [Denitrificimonas sp. JX-1]|uniref:Type I secretion system permease/ATPase n=1 Tax=Denitrificimonas halotolerans TaxID=3098930 RepID=A0ABU5GSM1_9GAMM|nr:type I secretion system permease/ATPase [Denitrificimonas sp. JX-1]MDY7219980.1 type I secretion system permease/ATPase [Denitrificimonas sp. JX-1]
MSDQKQADALASNEAKVMKKPQADYTSWIESILIVAKHYRLECSKENISLASHWLQDSPMSDVLRGMARQAGLTLSVVKLKKSVLTSWRLPLVVQFTDGQVAVVDTLDQQGQVGITYCGDEGVKSSISEQTLLDNVNLAVVLRPSHTVPDARIDDYIKPHDQGWFKKLVLRDWRPYGHIFIASFVVNVLGLAGILFTRQVYDRVIPAESYSTLYVLFSGVIVAIIFGFVMRNMRARITDLVGKRADLRISDRVFGHALRIKNGSRPRSTGTFISQVRELDNVREMLTSTTVTAFADMPFFLLFCWVFWYLAGSLVWIPVVAVILMVVPGLLAQGKLREYANSAMRESSLRNAMLVEAVQGNEDIKTLQAEQRFQTQWNNYNAVSADVNLRLRSLTNNLSSWTQSVQGSAFAVIVLFGAPMVIEGDLTTGSLIAASILGSRMIGPMAGLTQVLNRWQQAKVAYNSINQLMELPVDNPDGAKKVHKTVINGNYSIKEATFFYGEDSPAPALKLKQLEIQQGEKIALLGRNGAGKSTLLQVLSGMLEAKSGVVTLDGVGLAHIDPADVRRDVGLMSQNAALFHGTIRENLMLGAPMARDEDMLRVLHMTGALQFIQKLPSGLDHVIAEGGSGLSGGQRQSLLLSRLLIRNPNVVLLDEPTAAMDDTTEKLFLAQLKPWVQDKTFIVATHKMSVVNMVDRIIVVDNGQIVLDAPKADALARLSGKTRAATKA